MTTLLYGGKPEADVAPGNRADAEHDPGESGTHPRLLPTVELRATAVQTPDTFGAPERYASSVPATAPNVALPSMMTALAAVAAIFAGLALMGVALVWWTSMSMLAGLAVMGLGAYLIALGIALIISTQPPRFA